MHTQLHALNESRKNEWANAFYDIDDETREDPSLVFFKRKSSKTRSEKYVHCKLRPLLIKTIIEDKHRESTSVRKMSALEEICASLSFIFNISIFYYYLKNNRYYSNQMAGTIRE